MPTSRDDAIEALLATAKADVASSMQPADAAMLDAVSPERREAALMRLAVLRLWNAAGPRTFTSVADAARRAGVSRSAFYRMVQAVPELGLLGLGLHLRRARSVAAADALGTESVNEDRASTSVRSSSDGGGRTRPSSTPRCETATRPRSSGRTGRVGRIVLDAASMDLVDGAGFRQRLYAMLDMGTSLILAWTVHPDRDLAGGYSRVGSLWRKRSAALAPEILGRLEAEPAGGSIAAHMTRDSDVVAIALLSSIGVRIDLDARHVGAALVDALGDRLGGHALMVGFAPAGVFHRSRVQTSLPILTEGASERIADAIEAHNAAALQLAAAGEGASVVGCADDVAEQLAKLRLHAKVSARG